MEEDRVMRDSTNAADQRVMCARALSVPATAGQAVNVDAAQEAAADGVSSSIPESATRKLCAQGMRKQGAAGCSHSEKTGA